MAAEAERKRSLMASTKSLRAPDGAPPPAEGEEGSAAARGLGGGRPRPPMPGVPMPGMGGPGMGARGMLKAPGMEDELVAKLAKRAQRANLVDNVAEGMASGRLLQRRRQESRVSLARPSAIGKEETKDSPRGSLQEASSGSSGGPPQPGRASFLVSSQL